MEFEVFWKEYPRPNGKIAAQKAWAKLNGDGEKVMQGLALWKRCRQWQRIEFVPYASTFLNQKRYEEMPVDVGPVIPELEVGKNPEVKGMMKLSAEAQARQEERNRKERESFIRRQAHG